MAATRRDWLVRGVIVSVGIVVLAIGGYFGGPKASENTGPFYLRDEPGTLLSIEQRTYWRLAEAWDHRDQRPMHTAISQGDAFFVDAGAELAVLKREPPITWVEVVTGPQHGRRGWLATDRVKP